MESYNNDIIQIKNGITNLVNNDDTKMFLSIFHYHSSRLINKFVQSLIGIEKNIVICTRGKREIECYKELFLKYHNSIDKVTFIILGFEKIDYSQLLKYDQNSIIIIWNIILLDCFVEELDKISFQSKIIINFPLQNKNQIHTQNYFSLKNKWCFIDLENKRLQEYLENERLQQYLENRKFK